MAKQTERVTKQEVGGTERLVADEDLYVERTDLGEGVFTFVAKGDPVPVGLEGFPRQAAGGHVPDEPVTPTIR